MPRVAFTIDADDAERVEVVCVIKGRRDCDPEKNIVDTETDTESVTEEVVENTKKATPMYRRNLNMATWREIEEFAPKVGNGLAKVLSKRASENAFKDWSEVADVYGIGKVKLESLKRAFWIGPKDEPEPC